MEDRGSATKDKTPRANSRIGKICQPHDESTTIDLFKKREKGKVCGQENEGKRESVTGVKGGGKGS